MPVDFTEFQEALYEELTGDAALVALLDGDSSRIGDWPDPETKMPHITIGEDTGKDYSDKDLKGLEIVAEIHIWSENRGFKEAKQIASRVHQILTKNTLSIDVAAGFRAIGTADMLQNAVFLTEEDGEHKHAIMPFRFLTEEVI